MGEFTYGLGKMVQKGAEMNANEDLFICGKHAIPVFHRDKDCPWCDFIDNVKRELEMEFKRGFAEGMDAGRAEVMVKEKEKV